MRMPRRKKVGEFRGKVSATSDEKKLKDRTSTYTYGTVSVRSTRLKPHVGKTVLIVVYLEEESQRGAD